MKRSREGYLSIDHRFSPGISDEMAVSLGLPPGSGKGLFECPTITCSHCQNVVMLNPKRDRERAFCMKCDRYLCDACGAVAAMTKECRDFRRVLDQAQEAGSKLIEVNNG